MKTKPPPNRYEFANEWDEISYLYDKLLYWLYQRADPRRARPYAKRLDHLLSQADPDHEAIFGEECRSLVHEAKGNLAKAIKHRKHEIRLIHRLRRRSRGKPYERIALKGYDYNDLSDRLNLLAMLYHDSGNLDKAISTLEKSKKLCQERGIRFDAEDLLREYLEEANGNTIVVRFVVGTELAGQRVSGWFEVKGASAAQAMDLTKGLVSPATHPFYPQSGSKSYRRPVELKSQVACG